MYRYWSRTLFSYNGTIITADTIFNTGGQSYWPFWTFMGTVWSTKTGGYGETSADDFARGEFRYCPTLEVCSYYLEYIHKTQYGTGEYD